MLEEGLGDCDPALAELLGGWDLGYRDAAPTAHAPGASGTEWARMDGPREKAPFKSATPNKR